MNRALLPADALLGRTDWAKHEIDDGNARPIRQKQFLISRKLEEEMHRQVREILAGLIEPSSSPWTSPVFMVPKAGNKHRMVIDMRKVNAAAKGGAYLLPNMDQILQKLQAARTYPP